MKIGFRTACLSTLISLFAHVYLTLHYFALKFGYATGPSLCNVNATFNCDAVAASSYAAFLGIPLSLWGMATNLVLLSLIILGWLEWQAHPPRTRRFAWALATLNLAGSVVMGSVSLLYLKTFCLVCIGLYVLSLVTYLAVQDDAATPRLRLFREDVTNHLGASWRYVATLLAIPAIAFVANQMFAQNASEQLHAAGNSNQIDQYVKSSLAAWAEAPRLTFVAKPSLVIGPPREKSKLSLIEFADFRCGHCKHAGTTLDAFVKSHPDVRLEFYAFPLDGECNAEIKNVNRISCRLAEAVYCAETTSARGWEMHHALYAAQDDINSMESVGELDLRLAKISGELGTSWAPLKTCIEGPAALDAMRAQSKQGTLSAVRGTPTIFADSRLLEGAQMLPVLEAAYSAMP